MKNPRSPTLLSLISLGLVLVVLPLIASIVMTVGQVDRLAKNSRADMLAVQEDTATSRALIERATLAERSARQFQALGDNSYRALFAEHRGEALDLLGRLVAGKTDADLLQAAADFRQSANRMSALVDEGTSRAGEEEFEVAVAGFRDAVMRVTQAQNVISREMAGSLPESARQLKRYLMMQAMLVISVSAGLALVFFFIIRSPLKQIGESIRAMGRGALRDPIVVEGPRDLEALGQRLEWLRRRLVELEAQKSQFLRNVSHELKTPLTNIREGTELLLDDHQAEHQGEIVQVARIVRDNSVRLQQMIEALLRYGADGDLKAGKRHQPLKFDHLVSEAIERQAITARARSVTLRQILDPAPLFGNAKCLQVIVDNLISNALKYTPPGGTVEVRLRAGANEVQLDVKDDGPGISEDDRAHIFEWFYKGPSPLDSVLAGTGMGLAIAQEYAEQHGGRIYLLSSSEGAHFRLTLRTKHR